MCNTRISHNLFYYFWCIKGTVSQELHQSKIAVACGILYTGIRLAVRLSLLFANIRHQYFFVYMYGVDGFPRKRKQLGIPFRSMSSFFRGLTETVPSLICGFFWNEITLPTLRTSPPGYIGWRTRFLGIDSWAPYKV